MGRGMPWVFVGAGIAVMGAILQVGACTKSIEDSGVSSCGPMADDGNPCTIEVCEGSVVTRENAPSDTQCKIGDTPGTCNSGQCQITCPEGQCPDPTTCQTRECADGTCVISNKPMGPNAEVEDVGDPDCLVPGCDGAGKEVEGGVPDDTNIPANKDCVTYACANGISQPTNAEVGNACSSDSSKVCDQTQACVTCIPGDTLGCETDIKCYEGTSGPACSTCGNGAKDGEETDIDCGGPAAHQGACPTCAIAQDCSVDADCVGAIPGCRQGVCCDANCMNPCSPCNAPWAKGGCTTLPSGTKTEMVVGGENVPCVCDESSVTCIAATMAKGVGDECMNDDDCLTGKCATKVCKLKAGKGCFFDTDCESGDCDDTYHCT